MSQSQPLRIENPDYGSIGMSKTVNSALWFVNNTPLEEQILGYLAKYQQKYDVVIYAFVMQGNHFHLEARFPNRNRASFYKDFNSRTAECVRKYVLNYPGGSLFRRRYSEQAIVGDEDIEKEFFYCALQAVKSGLAERISDYPGYNSFSDAISGRDRKCKLIRWGAFNQAKRDRSSATIEEFTDEYNLTFTRIPGYEGMPTSEYKNHITSIYDQKRCELVRQRKKEGKWFLGKKALRKVKAGSLPRTTKTSKRNDFRPLVICSCPIARKAFYDWYFSIYEQYKEAVKKYLLGDKDAEFPPWTYKPPGPIVQGAI